jgi:hypothetical protein
MAIWNILWRFGIFYAHLVHFVFVWYGFSGFGVMYQEKSGNPDKAPCLFSREKMCWDRCQAIEAAKLALTLCRSN